MVTAFLCAVTAIANAAPPPVTLVPAESRIAFVSKQMGVPVEGLFRRFDAQIELDMKKPEQGSVALQIDTGSASFNAPQADAELPTANWFDVAHFPRASFRSESIRNLGDGRLEVVGTLKLKGQSRPVTVPVLVTQTQGTSTASGSFTVRRLEFRVGDGEWADVSMVADEVRVTFRLILNGLAAP